MSVIKNQTRSVAIHLDGKHPNKAAALIVHLRYDDTCNNGYNTFAITGDLLTNSQFKKYMATGEITNAIACGMLHSEIEQYAPEYASLIPWHLCSEEGPIHYVANTRHHAENGNLEYARSTAIWPEATLEELTSTEALEDRLPSLIVEFKQTMIDIGFQV